MKKSTRNYIISVSLLLLMILSTIGLFFASSDTHSYLFHSFSAGDSAYHFFDDFVVNTQKNTTPFALLLILSFIPLLRVSPRFKTYQIRIITYAACLLPLLWWSTAFICAGIMLYLHYPWKTSTSSRTITCAVMLSLIGMALVFRFEKLPNMWDHALHIDAQGFLTLAKSLTSPYATNYREPLWVWISKGLTTLLPPASHSSSIASYLPLRLCTIALSSSVIIPVFLAGEKIFSKHSGVIAAFFCVINKSFIYRSLQGLRLEIALIALFLMLLCTFRPSQKKPFLWLRACLWGVVAASVILTKTMFIPFVLCCFLAALWLKTHTLRSTLIACGICIVLTAPYYLYCYNTFGDALYSGSLHINRFYYKSFIVPHHPEITTIPHLGLINIIRHEFGLVQSCRFICEGFLDSLFFRYALKILYIPCSWIVVIASSIGYTQWLANKEKRAFVILLLLLIGPSAFILGMLNHSPRSFDWRTVAHVAPIILFAGVQGIRSMIQWLSEKERPHA